MTYLKAIKIFAGLSILTPAAILFLHSCSTDTVSITFRYNYDRFIGKTNPYRLEVNRIGEAYFNGVKAGDFDVLIVFDYSETSKENRPGDVTAVTESSVWSFRCLHNATGTVETKSNSSELEFVISPRGEIVDFSIFKGGTDSSSTKHRREFYRQRLLTFPDYPVKIGDSWTRTTEVMLIDSSLDTTRTVHTFRGFTKKGGYDCAIIESKGQTILPVFINDGDSTQFCGQDVTDYNEVVYFAYKEGFIFGAEERNRLISDRTYISIKKYDQGPDWKKIELPPEKWEKVTVTRRYDMETSSQYWLVADYMARY